MSLHNMYFSEYFIKRIVSPLHDLLYLMYVQLKSESTSMVLLQFGLKGIKGRANLTPKLKPKTRNY